MSEILTSQHPRGSPLAASNPADMMVKSGANAEAAKKIMRLRNHYLNIRESNQNDCKCPKKKRFKYQT